MNFSLLENCTSESKWDKSDSCIEGNNNQTGCFPYEPEESLRFGIWVIINSVVGCIGNTFTILALGYTSNKKM